MNPFGSSTDGTIKLPDKLINIPGVPYLTDRLQKKRYLRLPCRKAFFGPVRIVCRRDGFLSGILLPY